MRAAHTSQEPRSAPDSRISGVKSLLKVRNETSPNGDSLAFEDDELDEGLAILDEGIRRSTKP